MNTLHPIAMTIAGFDPSGGAGLLADIKTFEQCGVYGFGCATANTIQDERRVDKVMWHPLDTILDQINILLKKYSVTHFKIGIVESCEVFSAIKTHLISQNPRAQIIWDPVLKSSSGYTFLKNNLPLENLLKDVSLITPNLPEFNTLFGSEEKAFQLSHVCDIYLKGGHNESKVGVDHLYSKGIKISFSAGLHKVHQKHGSGCVLSSAITAALATGHGLQKACRLAKNYTELFLSSHPSLLGWHKNVML
ncbi:Phosphomethylpyrimidine kinase [Fulvivirga imtechensis AK7]|uniref:hydroxymethylpyrimidine kinase n=1 Tax=Fulvivirga imtechensis AK7 TaxID=1237149 RepID=L8JH66_9BACT|nr:hydroxymethylpyrimidine/phosphomethylpyrimidine kinase [Fulvivirga imtechensis]ELR68165.1 Phosphomethylpyrimidine kinase [Fulvivirga imtechensis AK7]